MKTEKQIRNRANKSIAKYFGGKLMHGEKAKLEAEIKELIWVLDECLLVENGEGKLIEDKKNVKRR